MTTTTTTTIFLGCDSIEINLVYHDFYYTQHLGCSRVRPVAPSILTPQQVFSPLSLPTSSMSDFSPSISETSLPPSIFEPSAVIFDKDGTLVCFHTMWNSWCEELAKRLPLILISLLVQIKLFSGCVLRQRQTTLLDMCTS